MPARIPPALADRGGAADRACLVKATSRAALEHAVASGAAVRALPSTYSTAELLSTWEGRATLGLLHLGGDAALADLSALRVWELPVPASDTVHVLVPHARRPRWSGEHPVELHVRRSRVEFTQRERNGLRVVTLERAVVESWPLLSGPAQRAPVIKAVQRRMTTVRRLSDELALQRRLPGRSDLAALLALVAAGCHSELELWGHQHVFTSPRFDDLDAQVPVLLGGRSAYFDRYVRDCALAIELDGREYHDSPRDRERDLARDRDAAEIGVQTLRFPHRELVGDPEGCREQVWRVVQRRREQLQGAPALLLPQPRWALDATASPTGDLQTRR